MSNNNNNNNNILKRKLILKEFKDDEDIPTAEMLESFTFNIDFINTHDIITCINKLHEENDLLYNDKIFSPIDRIIKIKICLILNKYYNEYKTLTSVKDILNVLKTKAETQDVIKSGYKNKIIYMIDELLNKTH